MTWLIIGAVLVLAFGPILWILPSKKDRRLARLRQQARLEGFDVDVRTVNRLDADAVDRVSAGGEILAPVYQTATYSLSFPRKLRDLQGFRLLRSRHSQSPFKGWQFDQGCSSTDEDLLASLSDLVAGLAQDVVALELNERSLVCYWLEKPPADAPQATALKKHLDGFQQVIREAQSQREAARNFPDES